MVLLGLEQKLIAVPVIELRKEIAIIVGAMVDGLPGKRLVQKRTSRSCVRRERSQTVRTVDPVVLRAARSACAFAASFSG